MEIFSNRVGASQNVAFVGIAASLSLVLSVLASFVPLSGFFVIIVLPFLSFLTILLTENKYGILFLVATPLLCVAVTAYAFQETLFYVIPALLCGALFGYLSKWKVPLAISFFCSALLSMGLTYLSLPIIEAIYGIDSISFTLELLHLADKPLIYDIVPSFIFALSLAEVALAYLFGEVVGGKLRIERADDAKFAYLYPLMATIFASLSLGLISLVPAYSFAFLSISIYFAAFSLLSLGSGTPKYLYVILATLGLGAIGGFIGLYSFYAAPQGLVLLSFVIYAISIPSFIRGLELKKEGKPSIVK